jgi:hypothetical protein
VARSHGICSFRQMNGEKETVLAIFLLYELFTIYSVPEQFTFIGRLGTTCLNLLHR